MSAASRRLFFALWPADAVRHVLLRWQTHNLSAGMRWQHRDDLHITLHFLGQVEDDAVHAIAALGAAQRPPPFALALDRIDYWPGPRILCATPSTPPGALIRLRETLGEALTPLGFAGDTRPYRPHVTLARNVPGDARYGPLPPLRWTVDSLCLVESRPGRAPHYRPLRRWRID